MAVSRSGLVRTDLPFLRRRVKPGAASASGHSADQPAALVQPAASVQPAGIVAPVGFRGLQEPERPVRRRPFAAPGARDARGLDAHVPMVRLNIRQSAVGSLVITGATALVFESVTGLTGAATAAGEHQGAVVSTAGNRPLVGFHEGAALVTLRHVRELHRALVIGRGSRLLGLTLADGLSLTVSPWSADDLPAVSLLAVEGLLELRAERVPAAWADNDVHREFGFTPTPRVEFPRRSRENQ